MKKCKKKRQNQIMKVYEALKPTDGTAFPRETTFFFFANKFPQISNRKYVCLVECKVFCTNKNHNFVSIYYQFVSGLSLGLFYLNSFHLIFIYNSFNLTSTIKQIKKPPIQIKVKIQKKNQLTLNNNVAFYTLYIWSWISSLVNGK